MTKIKNIVFDLGGVLIDLSHDQAVRRFEEIGVVDAAQLLDPYEQKGIFLEVENGMITADEYCQKLREHTGKDLSYEEIKHAWLGFIVDVPQYKLDHLLKLREHYNVYLLSNTNPIIQEGWARTDQFSAAGRPIGDYFDKMYTSYEVGVTKPDRKIFDYMIADSGLIPSETLFVDDAKSNVEVGRSLGFQTYQPANGEDWREAVDKILNQ
ncbi:MULTISPECIES: HAD family phosphatase [Parabacteroides]|uniref:HAD family hydrolase n=1 Tax=Parabacteroides leei TaxID=2939491 RepID=UPI0018988500|nr:MULTISPECIES: HAD family phosphatase [Parabacteroides]MCL3849679.1 HAD family phosphatase [Parabacteroides leei]